MNLKCIWADQYCKVVTTPLSFTIGQEKYYLTSPFTRRNVLYFWMGVLSGTIFRKAVPLVQKVMKPEPATPAPPISPPAPFPLDDSILQSLFTITDPKCLPAVNRSQVQPYISDQRDHSCLVEEKKLVAMISSPQLVRQYEGIFPHIESIIFTHPFGSEEAIAYNKKLYNEQGKKNCFPSGKSDDKQKG